MDVTFTYMLGEFITLMAMAIALSMDAFSIGLGMGMYSLRFKQIASIGLLIGVFHVIMPLIGLGIGRYISKQLGELAGYIGGLLLIILGIQMLLSSFRKGKKTMIAPVGFGLFLFAVSVSLDSFSVGLSLGIFGARAFITILLFGIVSTIFTWVGLVVGSKVKQYIGSYGEAFGGAILFAFGLKLLLPF